MGADHGPAPQHRVRLAGSRPLSKPPPISPDITPSLARLPPPWKGDTHWLQGSPGATLSSTPSQRQGHTHPSRPAHPPAPSPAPPQPGPAPWIPPPPLAPLRPLLGAGGETQGQGGADTPDTGVPQSPPWARGAAAAEPGSAAHTRDAGSVPPSCPPLAARLSSKERARAPSACCANCRLGWHAPPNQLYPTAWGQGAFNPAVCTGAYRG